jgi:hypothetical protein
MRKYDFQELANLGGGSKHLCKNLFYLLCSQEKHENAPESFCILVVIECMTVKTFNIKWLKA